MVFWAGVGAQWGKITAPFYSPTFLRVASDWPLATGTTEYHNNHAP
jgi:hypothetical protein